jgi:prefoldin subunit 5
MARQISMDAALAAYRRKCADLLDANILLEAQLAEVEAECEQLRAAAPAPVSDELAP